MSAVALSEQKKFDPANLLMRFLPKGPSNAKRFVEIVAVIEQAEGQLSGDQIDSLGDKLRAFAARKRDVRITPKQAYYRP